MAEVQIEGSDGRYRVRGELGFKTVNAVLAESETSLFGAANTALSVDLGEVSRVDSAGLALLLQWMRMARQRQITIHYLHLPQQLLEIARAGDLDALLPVAA